MVIFTRDNPWSESRQSYGDVEDDDKDVKGTVAIVKSRRGD